MSNPYIEKLAISASEIADRMWSEAARDGLAIRADVTMVRAVLTAMREPSEDMTRMGVLTQHLRSDIQGGTEEADRHWMECSFRSMINAALAEHPATEPKVPTRA